MIIISYKIGKHLLDSLYKSEFEKNIINHIKENTNSILILIISSKQVYKINLRDENSNLLKVKIISKINEITNKVDQLDILNKKLILKDYVDNILPKIKSKIYNECFSFENNYYYKSNNFQSSNKRIKKI